MGAPQWQGDAEPEDKAGKDPIRLKSRVASTVVTVMCGPPVRSRRGRGAGLPRSLARQHIRTAGVGPRAPRRGGADTGVIDRDRRGIRG